ncbi:adenosine kinase [Rhizobium herbae]|uniref:Sugar/nucleoside kinase (Ribokinase family) n=1 Tax=Rhizobium herbae TaxID=508661 RepID=A0ABS4EVP8_9HYPH|nr:adenosine kinase [Rhizobium herbae]MBP1862014.1 sugar/nucleoside kinase (ribokinase family) [Rhizobium herbae]
MTPSHFDVLTIGNAIVDIIAPVPPSFLDREGLKRGIMHLIDESRAESLYRKMPPQKQQISGGSAANTAAGVASLGARASFVGKVSDDALGDFFADDLAAAGVHYKTKRLRNGEATARSMILITPDGERTMNTHLGACHQLTEADIDENHIGAATITFMEGFLWDPPEAKKAFLTAARYAHKHGKTVAFTLSDPFCVSRYRKEFLELIRSGTVDVLLANIHELLSLYQTADLREAVRLLKSDVPLAAVTMGSDGAMVVRHSEEISISAYPVAEVVDVTGAGDLFAAGFLLGISTGLEPAKALRLGCSSASEVITHIGARPESSLENYVRRQGIFEPPLPLSL